MWAYSDKGVWTPTGKTGTALSVGTDAAGNDEVFLRGLDGMLSRYDLGKWTATNGGLASFQADHGELYGLAGDGEVWLYDDKTGWKDQHHTAKKAVAGTDLASHDHLFTL